MAVPGRLTMLLIGLLAGLAACSGSGDDIADLPPEPPTSATSSTTTSTQPSTTEQPSTTLSEVAKAEAEVQEIVEAWFLFPWDSAEGPIDGMGADYLTGILELRVIELAAQLEEDGQIERTQVPSQIEVTGIEIDFDAGFASVDACAGSGIGRIDAETLEVLGVDDPNDTSTVEFVLELTEAGWKINEWYPSVVTGQPISCEIKS